MFETHFKLTDKIALPILHPSKKEFKYISGEPIMKKIIIMAVSVFCLSATVQAGWLDKVKDAVPDSIKQKVQEQTEGTVKQAEPSGTSPISGVSPDQKDANECSAYVHEDYKKEQKALKTSNLTRGSARYLPKKEWVDYLESRYPNMKREKNDFYIHFGKWFGKSCAYFTLKCVPGEPGCNAEMRCLDFYTRKGGRTCPPNVCDAKDSKCIESYKPVEK
jgi:hypothetical protein